VKKDNNAIKYVPEDKKDAVRAAMKKKG